jgi:hypothetical protein
VEEHGHSFRSPCWQGPVTQTPLRANPL